MIDVCLLLEGTYPYVAGGVSTWVHQLVSAVKDVRFAIVYIAPHSDPTRRVKYVVPQHVVYLKEIYLHDYELSPTRRREPTSQDYEGLRLFYEGLGKKDYEVFRKVVGLFQGEDHCLDIETVFFSKQVWKLLTDFYDRHSPEISFIDFFWTWRSTHLPLLQILQANIPRAKIYHSISTGYAGLLGAMARIHYGGKYFLTEHGIYTHERMLEISQASWIYEQEKKRYRAERDLSFFKKWWIEMFRVMSGLSYHYADRIFTLFEGNKVREILEGASPEKITIIPNGIDIREYQSIQYEKKKTPQIGLVGRVVSIKDIKTFIQAARIALSEIPDATFYVIGPTDEESEYYDECRLLAETLNLEGKVIFTGRVNIKDYYRFLDVVVLTSVSEAQPYVILEANISGIPVVATDVGACRELIQGRKLEDKALGPGGIITSVADPKETAAAIVKLVQDQNCYQRMSEAGKERVKRFYDQDDLLSRYLNIYEQNR